MPTTSFDDLLDEATPTERVVTICLDGAKYTEHSDAVQTYLAAQDKVKYAEDHPGAGMMTDRADLAAAQTRVAEIEREMEARAAGFRLRTLSNAEHQELLLKFPPRDGYPLDQQVGHNIDAVTVEITRRSIVGMTGPDGAEVKMTENRWNRLGQKLSPAQFAVLAGGAMELLGREGQVPRLRLAFEEMGGSGETSKPHSDSASPPDGGGDGNPVKSRPSSTTRKAASPAP